MLKYYFMSRDINFTRRGFDSFDLLSRFPYIVCICTVRASFSGYWKFGSVLQRIWSIQWCGRTLCTLYIYTSQFCKWDKFILFLDKRKQNSFPLGGCLWIGYKAESSNKFLQVFISLTKKIDLVLSFYFISGRFEPMGKIW